MDFTKFVSMLDRRSLYLRNLEALSRTGPFEGVLPKNFFEHRNWTTLNEVPDEERKRYSHSGPLSAEDKLATIKSSREAYAKTAWSTRKSIYVNCWHMSEHESHAMWSIYANKGSGIAISSTFNRLESALNLPEGRELYSGEIKYSDYNTDPNRFIPPNLFVNAMTKRRSFEFERELRVVFWDTSISHKVLPNGVQIDREHEEIENLKVADGVEIPCDLDTLIQNIYLYPAAEEWFHVTAHPAFKRRFPG